MSRRVKVVLLCEDSQHEAFARRFLEKMGWPRRQLRVLKAPQGRGAGEQFVREHFPDELLGLRRSHVRSSLLVLVDGNAVGVAGRVEAFRHACRERGVAPWEKGEPVGVFVPTRSIETWLVYLQGQEVDETRRYPRLLKERACGEQVKALVEMCRKRELRAPAPPSLRVACEVWAGLSKVDK